MLRISDQAVAAFNAKAEAQRRAQFARWWQSHATILGSVDTFTAGQWLDLYASEAEVAGIDRDDQLFVYIAARRRMPDPEAWQYVAMMNVVCADLPDPEKLRQIDRIATGTAGHGQ